MRLLDACVSKRAGMFLLVFALAVAVPAPASASPLASVSIALMYETGESEPTLVIMGQLPPETPLPAEMLLPVPQDATIISARESFPDSTQDDVPVQAALTERAGIPAIALPLTESRIGIAELRYLGARTPQTGLENSFQTGFDVVFPVDTGYVFASVALPSDVEPQRAEPAAKLISGDDGRQYYNIERTDVVEGDRVFLWLDVHENWVAEPATWVIVVVGAVIVGAVLLLVLSRRRKDSDEPA